MKIKQLLYLHKLSAVSHVGSFDAVRLKVASINLQRFTCVFLS